MAASELPRHLKGKPWEMNTVSRALFSRHIGMPRIVNAELW